MEQILLGIFSFVITGVDDFLVLLSFHLLFPNRFKEVLLGTLLGLICVMIPSFVFSGLIQQSTLYSHINVNYITSAILLWIGLNLFLDGIKQNKDISADSNLYAHKSSLQVVFIAGNTYFWNGLDDFLVYSGFFMKEQNFNNNLFFSLGILIGLALYAILTSFLGKKSLELGDKNNNKIKIGLSFAIFCIAMAFLL